MCVHACVRVCLARISLCPVQKEMQDLSDASDDVLMLDEGVNVPYPTLCLCVCVCVCVFVCVWCVCVCLFVCCWYLL